MEIECYLIIDSKGQVKVRKGKGSLNHDEIDVKLNIKVEDSLFKKPTFEGSMEINGDTDYELVILEQKLKELKKR